MIGLSGATVLLVEDEPTLRRAVAMRLGREGWAVVEAGTAKEALEAVARTDIDLVLLDQGLPDGDGAELVGRFRSVSPETVIIVLTGNLSVASAVRAIQEGAPTRHQPATGHHRSARTVPEDASASSPGREERIGPGPPQRAAGERGKMGDAGLEPATSTV